MFSSRGPRLVDRALKPEITAPGVAGRGGEPIGGQITMLREGYHSRYLTGSGTLDVLVPEGTYSLWMWGEVEGTHGPNSVGVALLTAPRVVVDANTTVELSAAGARAAKAERRRRTALDYHRELGDTAAVTDSYVVVRTSTTR